MREGDAPKPRRVGGSNRKRRFPAALVFSLCVAAAPAPAAQRFQADEWITECGGAPASRGAVCSITVPFWQTGRGAKGSFALVVMLQTANVGVVGSPAPLRAVLRVDKSPAVSCSGGRYCIFPTAEALAIVRQLANATLILIDVFTAKSQFSFSLSPKGYQAGIAQIRAWGYHPGDE
jgi:hypothetical protein